jgi:hypothetical protein
MPFEAQGKRLPSFDRTFIVILAYLLQDKWTGCNVLCGWSPTR